MKRCLALIVSLLVMAQAVLAADPPARAELDRTLESMSAAALKADKAAFMALVDPSEPYFKQEQAAWCDDLVKRGVAEVRFALADEPAPTFGDQEIHGTIKIRYK